MVSNHEEVNNAALPFRLTLRDPVRADIPRLVDLELIAHQVPDPFLDTVLPERFTKPTLLRLLMLNHIRSKLFFGQARMVVGEIEVNGVKEVVGAVSFYLTKPAIEMMDAKAKELGIDPDHFEEKKQWSRQTTTSWIEKKLLQVEFKYQSFFFNMYAKPPKNPPPRPIFKKARQIREGTPAVGIAGIVVDPKYRNLGIGRQLMAWGMERTKDLPILLFALPTAVGFYRSIGMTDIVEMEKKDHFFAWGSEDVISGCLDKFQ